VRDKDADEGDDVEPKSVASVAKTATKKPRGATKADLLSRIRDGLRKMDLLGAAAALQSADGAKDDVKEDAQSDGGDYEGGDDTKDYRRAARELHSRQ
jgi:hypothetical protein